MKLDDIYDGTDGPKITDFDRFFDIYEDPRQDVYWFNLNSTMYFDASNLPEKNVDHDAFWTQLSYKIYGTTRLWWVLMKVNGVDARSMFDVVRAGSKVKYIELDTLNLILGEL